MENRADIQSLNHGTFHFPRPNAFQRIGYIFSVILFLVGLFLYSSSLSIPDVPRLDEAEQLAILPEDLSALDFQPVQKGYDPDEYAAEAAFIIVPMELRSGTVAEDSCRWVEDSEGNGGSWSYNMDTVGAQTLVMVDASGTDVITAFSLQGSLTPEVNLLDVECSSHWTRSIEGYGEGEDNHLFAVYFLVEQDPIRYQVLSIGEISDISSMDTMPDEVTQREDSGRWALLATGVGGLVFMLSTSPSLKYDLRRLRKENRKRSLNIASSVGVLGISGRLFQHLGPNFEVLEPGSHPSRDAADDWIFGAPALPESYENPYAPDPDGMLMLEHPKRLGTPTPATITPFSIGAVIFASSFIWLSADLRARDGSDFHTTLGWAMTIFVTVVNFIWFYMAWRQFKLVRLVNDLPTSPIRSVAVGQAEIVGQVRPSIAGTPVMEVGGRAHKGLVYWEWSSYREECSTDSDGNTSCTWKHVETRNGGVPFMVHDGSGGMLIDPEEWKNHKLQLGPIMDQWDRGKWRWHVSGLGVGDPIYLLGDCVPRTQQHKDDWGCDETLGNALVTMVPSKDTGDASVMHYGTELDLLSKNRSIFEILIVPLLIFTFGVFMFLNYTP
jgi:hypothetical protein